MSSSLPVTVLATHANPHLYPKLGNVFSLEQTQQQKRCDTKSKQTQRHQHEYRGGVYGQVFAMSLVCMFDGVAKMYALAPTSQVRKIKLPTVHPVG